MPDTDTVKWSDLLNREYGSKIAVLALALWLHASNSNLTATTMPSAAAEIGGLNLLSWTFALYLAGSIVAGASMSLVVAKYGIRGSMIRCAVVYAIGCMICALTPAMEVLLVGRTLQGLGGGGLVSVVFIAQDRFFPNRFVPRIVALTSVVWTTASFIGPTIGGAFATMGLWRYAFVAFALQAFLLAFIVGRILKADIPIELERARIPLARLFLLTLSILCVSYSGSNYDAALSPLLVIAGIALIGLFLYRDHGAVLGRMMPTEGFRPGHPLSSGLLATLTLSLSIMAFLVYGPHILIHLHGLTPFSAGIVIMVESSAWGLSAVLFSKVSPAREHYVIRTGSALVPVGLLGIAYTLGHGPLWLMILFLIINNAGMGMMWGFIIRGIIDAASNAEKARAASAIPITQQTGFALGAAFCGVIANGLGLADDADAATLRRVAFWLFTGFVPIALMGNYFAWRFTR